jgi:hypothetical protein
MEGVLFVFYSLYMFRIAKCYILWHGYGYSQRITVKSTLLPPLCGFQGLNSGHQACRCHYSLNHFISPYYSFKNAAIILLLAVHSGVRAAIPASEGRRWACYSFSQASFLF